MSRQIILPGSFAWCVTLGVLFSLSVSYSDDITVPVTVTNRTAHYLHVIIGEQSFTYVAPGSAAETEVNTNGVTIYAIYSPGQGKSGGFTNSYPTSETVTSSGGSSCNSETGSCEPTGPETTTTPTPVQVELFPQNFQ